MGENGSRASSLVPAAKLSSFANVGLYAFARPRHLRQPPPVAEGAA